MSLSTRIEQLRPTVLVVDDDQPMRLFLKTILKKEYSIFEAKNSTEAFDVIRKNSIDVILLDIRLGSENGIEILKQVKEHDNRIEVIMITVVKDLKTAIKAIKYGAFDYINKEFQPEEVKNTVNNAIQRQRLSGEIQSLRSEIETYSEVSYVSGFGPVMKEVNEVINRVSKMPSNVLIQGESGTGKEIFARRIHGLGQNELDGDETYRPFIAVNIASIPENLVESALFGHEKGSFTGAYKTRKGKFELAHGGTLFLDEISELKIELQAKLLRAIQEKEIERVGGEYPIKVNTRIVAASNKDLSEMVKQGKFREDLYYRLNVIPIYLPPLRERIEDIPEFISLFIVKYSKKLNKKVEGVTPEVAECLQSYSWPGNIRELENIIERMVALSDTNLLKAQDVPIELQFLGLSEASDHKRRPYEEVLKEATTEFEKRFIMSALNRQNWNQLKTAEYLGIHRKTLEYKIKKLDLQEIIEAKRKLRHKV